MITNSFPIMLPLFKFTGPQPLVTFHTGRITEELRLVRFVMDWMLKAMGQAIVSGLPHHRKINKRGQPAKSAHLW